MAETASSAVVAESENSAGSNNSVLRIVAPPKFVFGQNMSERIKPHPDDDGGSSSDDENSNSGGVKRSAEDEEKKDSDSEQEAGCLSPVKKVARLEGKEQEELSEEVKPLKLLFKPSMLSEVAKNLACSSTKVDRNSMTSPIPKTLGVSSSESTASEKSTDTSVRSHESAPGELGIIGPDSENYFQQFLTGKVPSAQPSSGAFVFGQNMGERVMFSQENDSEGERDTDKSEEKPAETIVTREHKLSSPVFAEKEPKTLAEVAQSCAVAQGPTSPTQEKPHKSLAEAAMAYQEHFSPPKTQPARVTVVTGEEEERNVLQSNCRLFVFDTVTHSWRERGRGVLRLNDMCQSMSEGIFQSRLVMRTQGSLRVVLNTKLWPKMTLEKGNERSLRITAMDSEKDIKIYLVMAAPNDIQRLWTAIDRRIQALKRGQDDLATQDGADHDHTPDDEEESKNEPDDKFEGPGAEDDDDSVKDRCEAPDESSNDSCPTGEDRGKETAPDADDD